MAKLIDISGARFGFLVALRPTGIQHGGNSGAQWSCVCDCGTTLLAGSCSLRSGHTKSCGCKKAALVAAARKTHGHSQGGRVSPTYGSWHNMLRRCSEPTHNRYHLYGGRGVTVCDRWANSFENFLEDMGERPEGKTLDRVDVNGNYEPANCKWSTPTEQARNRRAKA